MRGCKLFSDLNPTAVVFFDLAAPTSPPREPIAPGTLPSSIQKVVLVLNGTPQASLEDSVHVLLPISVTEIVIVLKAGHQSFKQVQMAWKFAEMVAFDAKK